MSKLRKEKVACHVCPGDGEIRRGGRVIRCPYCKGKGYRYVFVDKEGQR